MIFLYTDMTQAGAARFNWIRAIDPFFDSYVGVDGLVDEDFGLIQKLEGAVLVDKRTGLLQSTSGYFRIEDLSTGLKTLLLIRWLKRMGIRDRGVDITECGPNILDVVFDELVGSNIPVILRHTDILSLPNREIKINNRFVVRTMANVVDAMLAACEDDEDEA